MQSPMSIPQIFNTAPKQKPTINKPVILRPIQPNTPRLQIMVHLHRDEQKVLVDVDVYRMGCIEVGVAVDDMTSGFGEPVVHNVAVKWLVL